MENTQASTTTTDAEGVALVLKDSAGNYFLVPQETLERGRVPEEQKAELERRIADSDDVSGHFIGIVIGVSFIVVGLTMVGIAQGPATGSIPKGQRETGNKI